MGLTWTSQKIRRIFEKFCVWYSLGLLVSYGLSLNLIWKTMKLESMGTNS